MSPSCWCFYPGCGNSALGAGFCTLVSQDGSEEIPKEKGMQPLLDIRNELDAGKRSRRQIFAAWLVTSNTRRNVDGWNLPLNRYLGYTKNGRKYGWSEFSAETEIRHQCPEQLRVSTQRRTKRNSSHLAENMNLLTAYPHLPRSHRRSFQSSRLELIIVCPRRWWMEAVLEESATILCIWNW